MIRHLRHRLLALLLLGIALSGALALLAQPGAWVAVAVCVGTMALIVLIWYRVARQYLATALGRLRRVADDIGRGHAAPALVARPGDDLYKLVKAVNTLAERLHRANQEERRLHEQLRRGEKLAVLGELAATVAHEVNNPLDGVQNCVRILRRTDDPARAAHMLELIDGGLHRIEVIVRRLLTLARENVVRPVEADIVELVSAALADCQADLAHHGIRVATDFAERPAPARVDAPLMQQVFANLVRNAVDSMPAGGTLAIHVARETGAAAAPPALFVDIRDTGSGIAPDVLPHIFEPFFTTKRDGKGVGLGLAIAVRIVDAHRGTISVSPEPQGGTRFRVRLPALQAQPRAASDTGWRMPVPEDA